LRIGLPDLAPFSTRNWTKAEYDQETLAAYLASKAVIVSTYSSIFNVAPGLTDAQVIMLDDAHAAEYYVAKMWSVSISRSDHNALYHALARVLGSALPNYMPGILVNDSATPDQKQSTRYSGTAACSSPFLTSGEPPLQQHPIFR
jgi:hypothetical protein